VNSLFVLVFVDLLGKLINLCDLLVLIDEDLFRVCGRGLQLLHWEKTNVFCGRCGARTRAHEQERARVCPQCGLTVYPRISPAVIVAVARGGKILLARNRNFRRAFHSVLAGFIEPGETFEDCVRREIREEVGISVGNIRYFGSQPWPFPDSLMVGFTADYEHGELAVDGREIVQADWYAPDCLPPIPPPGSISRKLIDCFVRGELNRN
ncbi:MAG TPA: NAD(+) diphosphatase, partial [bacterium]|nr:NAD(+) diphosphatase [bacterium]